MKFLQKLKRKRRPARKFENTAINMIKVMKRYANIPAFIISLCVILSCASGKKPAQPGVVKSNEATQDSHFFSMERTPCYGTCPVYVVKVYKSGFSTLEAARNMGDKNGSYVSWFSSDELKSIKDKASEINFFQLKDEYNSPVTDLPTVIVTLKTNGRSKTIRDRHHAPAELRQFEKMADGIINGKEWKKQ